VTAALSLFVNAGGVKTHFYAQGAGAPVVFVHGGGIGSNADSWLRVMGDVAVRRQAFAPDTIGFGRSAAPALPYDAQRIVDHVRDFVDALCLDRVTLVGHSLGATIVARLALQLSERVAGVVMVAPGGGALGFTYHSDGHVALDRALAEPSPENVRELVRLLRSRDEGIEHDVADRLVAATMPAHLAALRAYGASSKEPAAVAPLATQLPASNLPIMLMWGKRERFNPPDLGDRIAEKLPNLRRYAVFQTAGHYIHYDEPEQFSKTLIEFLDEVEVASCP
jgi:pimeloyl-ACP methyl ester carboxylesterase